MALLYILGLLESDKVADCQPESLVKVVGCVVLATVVLSIVKLFGYRGRIFDEKLEGVPPHPSREKEEDTATEYQRKFALLESQIQAMRNSIESLKGSISTMEKNNKDGEKAPVASASKSSPEQLKASSKKKKNNTKISYEDVLTFQQKKDLSDSIGKLHGPHLERVIQIIHEGVPEIRESTEDVELEIDELPTAVLIKLYNYVLRPMRNLSHPNHNHTGKPRSTSGSKRRSMDEEKEERKIRQLEDRVTINDRDVLTFGQKKDLAESIGKLDGARLEQVIQIIRDAVPEIRDSTEEIELEIDKLPAAVLNKLYKYLRPTCKPRQPKHNRTGKGTEHVLDSSDAQL